MNEQLSVDNPRPRIPPYVAIVPICAGVFIAADDQTVIVTVLPQIMLDLKVQITELDRASWTITGYLLGYVAAMPLIGRMSDVWGHRNLYVISMLLFMVGSVFAAITTDLTTLVAARVFQAVGAGALVPISIAMVGDIFPSAHRGIPLGIVGASAEAGGVIGPLWGGIIIRYLDWPWVFWINIPLGVLVLVLLLPLVGPSPRFPAKIDYLGGVFLAVCLSTLTLGYRLPTISGLAFIAVGFWFMSRWGLDVADPSMTVHLALAGFGFGLLIAPIALAATNSVDAGLRGAAAALITAMRMVGMTFGLATLTAWGTGRFQELVAGMTLPLPMPGDTAEQAAERLSDFQTRLTDAGLSLFSDFYLIAMAVSVVAIAVAVFMSRGSGVETDETQPDVDV